MFCSKCIFFGVGGGDLLIIQTDQYIIDSTADFIMK